MSKGNRTTGSRYITKAKNSWYKLKAEDLASTAKVTKYARVAIEITSLRDLDKIDAVADPSVVELLFVDADLKDTVRLILISNKKHIFSYIVKNND